MGTRLGIMRSRILENLYHGTRSELELSLVALWEVAKRARVESSPMHGFCEGHQWCASC